MDSMVPRGAVRLLLDPANPAVAPTVDGNVVELEARSPLEVTLFLRSEDLEEVGRSVKEEGAVARIAVDARWNGDLYRWHFVVPAPLSPTLGGGVSTLLDAAAWKRLASDFARRIPADPSEVSEADLPTADRFSELSVTCMDELLKCIDAAGGVLRETDFRTPVGRTHFREKPWEFQRPMVEAVRGAYQSVLARYRVRTGEPAWTPTWLKKEPQETSPVVDAKVEESKPVPVLQFSVAEEPKETKNGVDSNAVISLLDRIAGTAPKAPTGSLRERLLALRIAVDEALDRGDETEARKRLDEAVVLVQTEAHSFGRATWQDLERFAWKLAQWSLVEQSVAFSRAVVLVAERLFGAQSQQHCLARLTYAMNFMALPGNGEEGKALLLSVLRDDQERRGENALTLAALFHGAALNAVQQGDIPEAIAKLEQAMGLVSRAEGEDSVRMLELLPALSEQCRRAGDARRALFFARRVLSLAREYWDAGVHNDVLCTLGTVVQLNEPEQRQALYSLFVAGEAEARAKFGSNGVWTLMMVGHLASIEHSLGRRDAARERFVWLLSALDRCVFVPGGTSELTRAGIASRFARTAEKLKDPLLCVQFCNAWAADPMVQARGLQREDLFAEHTLGNVARLRLDAFQLFRFSRELAGIEPTAQQQLRETFLSLVLRWMGTNDPAKWLFDRYLWAFDLQIKGVLVPSEELYWIVHELGKRVLRPDHPMIESARTSAVAVGTQFAKLRAVP